MNTNFYKCIQHNPDYYDETIIELTEEEVKALRNIKYLHIITESDFDGYNDVERIIVTENTIEIQGHKYNRADLIDLSIYEYQY